ncbi:MAG: 4Fe-4S binding protein [Bacillota bacterium]|nr:4Fe-4S binding protein [Bacillota bacterium]
MAKGILKLREERCKGCELCVSVCPKNVLKIHDSRLNQKGYHPVSVEKADDCIACGSCALMCPDGVISIYVKEGEEK